MRKFTTKQTKLANNMDSLCCCFRMKASTMHGKKTLLWSTSSLAKRPLWVRWNYEGLDYCLLILLVLSLPKKISLCRNGKEDQNGSNRVHLVPGRPLWTLSWLQLHLLFRNRLLGDQNPFQVFFSAFLQALSHPGIIGEILGKFELWPEANEISF